MSHQKSIGTSILAPHSKFYQGPFGRLCPNLPAWSPPGDEAAQDTEFEDFARTNMVELPGVSPTDIAKDQTTIDALETQFGSNIPAGYTYFGQFVDHDITHDPTSLSQRQVDPDQIINFRTPRLDLDSVYGRGAGEQPYLYDQDDKGKLLTGVVKDTNLPDLPRNAQGRALIGDMRNDENSIVSQLHLAFVKAHNALVQRQVDDDATIDRDLAFSRARKSLTRLYQWVVWNDFLKRIAVDEVLSCALRLEDRCGGRQIWDMGLKDVYNWKHQPFMPVEFSGAAYRFGHSMVRNSYQTNAPHRGFKSFAPIFDNSTPVADPQGPDDLRGFRAMQARNVIQWDWFLPMTSSLPGEFPQMARKIDTKLANALVHLHEGPSGDANNVLAFRNLKRGVNLGLPSGLDMARKYCLNPVNLSEGEPESLWYCILKEAETLPGANGGQMLGRLGSTIVCATFAGLLKGDPCSFFNVDPCWTPDDDDLLTEADKVDDPGWTLASIIRISGLPVDAGDVSDQT